jgi:hypothetical protein
MIVCFNVEWCLWSELHNFLGDNKGNWLEKRRVYNEYWIDKVLQKYILKYLKKKQEK